jgi:hypothetical protein
MSGSYVEIQSLVHRPVGLAIASQRPRGLKACSSEQTIQTLNLDPNEPTPQGDRLLFDHSQDLDDKGALLCLRCRISHPIRDKIQAIFNRHQDEHGLDLIEMASFVLDDDGALEFPARKGERKGVPFCWSVLSTLPEKPLYPFSAEVLRSYNPALCGLPHWARLKVQCNGELKTYLLQRGLMLISDWALLAHKTSPTRLRKAWSEYGTGMGLEQAMALHQAYQGHYPAALRQFTARTGKRSGWHPDEAFLQSLLPDLDMATATEKLKDLAKAVRGYLTASAAAKGFPDHETLDLADPATVSETGEDWSSQELMALITAALERAAPAAVRQALTDDQPSWAKKPERRLAWRLYGDGLGQRDIAEQCDRKQAWVSKLLQEQSLATTIATAGGVELRRHPAFAEVARSVEGAERLVAALRNHLTNPDREGDVAPLRRVVAEILASMQP